MSKGLVGFEWDGPDEGSGATEFSQNQAGDQRPARKAEGNRSTAGDWNGNHSDENTQRDAEREGGIIEFRDAAFRIAEEFGYFRGLVRRHDNAQPVADLDPGVGLRDDIDVGPPEAGDLGVEPAVQVELIEPGDPASMGDDYVMDHVGYVVGDIPSCMGECQSRGLRFVADTPGTNSVGQQVLYFETDTSMSSRMHLTRLPD